MTAARRLWALEPATYRSPADVALQGDAAPRIPFPVYLIEHEDGLVLFDGGLDPDFAGDPVGGYGAMAERIDIDFRPEHAIEAQLERRGFAVTDVETVVVSHLHFDHAGAIKRFPHATTYVGVEELDYARRPEAFSQSWFRAEDFDDRHGIQWSELPADHDVFGDGSVTALHLPGHTPGSLALMVRLPTRTLVLGGDVVHTRHGLESETHYHGDMDSVAARRSLRKLRFILRTQEADLWIAHDVADWERFGGAGVVR